MKHVFTAAGLLLGLALIATPARAQTGTPRGQVIDVESKPIADCKVTIEFTGGLPRKFTTKTNAKGEWVQVGVPSGNYRFTFSKEGFRELATDWRVSVGVTEMPTITLEKGARNAKEAMDAINTQFKAALELSNQGKYDEALVAYNDLLAKNPGLATGSVGSTIYGNIGYVYTQKKDFANAEASYMKVLDISPEDSNALLGLAGMYLAQGNKEKGKEYLDKATAANPGDPKAQYNKGIVLRNMNQDEAAVPAFQATIDADPNYAEAYFQLGQIYVGQNKINESIAMLEKYLSLKPKNAENTATAQALIQALKPSAKK